MRWMIMILAGLLAYVPQARALDTTQSTEAVMLDERALQEQGLEIATFAAGCFWCVESEFQALEGVKEVVSGYTGGTLENPTYQQVTGKQTGHYEAVRVAYDPEIISYGKLLEAFWLIHDPTQENGQGVDIGPQYRSAIFFHNPEQRATAEEAKAEADASGTFKRPIATEILPAETFYTAEDYHQDYYAKQGIDYESVFDLGGESTTMKKRKRWLGSMFGN